MTGRPRILILSAYYFPFKGGTETHARVVARSLHDAGFGVVVVTRRDDRGSPGVDQVDGVPVYRVRPGGPRTGFRKWTMLPFAALEILRRRRDFEVIYCPGYQGIGLAAIAMGRLLGRPVVLRSGNLGVLTGRQWDAPLERWHIPPQSPPVRWLKDRVQRIYMRTDAMVCNSRENEREALDCGLPAAKLHYLPNAVDVNEFRPGRPEEREEIRQNAGWPVGAKVCLYLGRLSLEKGVMDLLAAWQAVRSGPYRLVLVGPDMPGPLDAGPRARGFVASQGMQDVVFFHGETTDAAKLLRAADLYVLPSHYESFSNALVEAMATGLPCVASRVGGTLDCIADRENGLLFAPKDASDLGAKLQELIDHPEFAARLGARARDTIVRDFSHETTMRRFAELFRQVGVQTRS